MTTNARPVALVTGASSGIGKAFAVALADRGHDLVLVARDTERLVALAAELEAAYGAAAEVLTADLSDAAALATVEARVADPESPVDLVINNAGFGTVGKFADLPIEREQQEIQLNVVALVRLTHAAVNAQLGRGRGGVINVASIAGYQPTPENATYGATKAYVLSFSQSVHEELKGSGVKCMVLAPGFTRTEFQINAGFDSDEVPGFLWQDAPTVVSYALRAYDKGKATCLPGPLNKVTGGFTAVTPHAITRRMAGVIVRKAEK